MQDSQKHDNDMAQSLAQSQGHFVLTGQRGLAKDSLTRCLRDFAPSAQMLDVEDISAAAATPPTARLMLFDADEMPTMLPRDINRVRDRHIGIRIVAIGENNPQRARQLMLSSVDGFVPRSTRLSFFFEALRHVLKGGVYFPAACDERPVNHNPCRQILANRGEKVRDDLATLLTGRQRQVLALLGLGDSNKQIAKKLGIAEKTVKIHVGSICAQLGVENRTKAAVIGLTIPHLIN